MSWEHGTTWGYSGKGCRCGLCCAANTAAQQDKNASRASRQVPEGLHGKSSTYKNYRCRCAECRAAHTDALRRLASAPVPSERHGTLTGYFRHRCRCDECKAAGSVYNREYRQRIKAAS